MVPFSTQPAPLLAALSAECLSALAELQEPGEKCHYAIRRRLKVLRAWLRLYPFGEATLWQAENSLWKKHGQALSKGREKEALGETLTKLRTRFPDSLPAAVWDRYSSALSSQLAPLPESRRKLLQRDLNAAAQRFATWPEPSPSEIANKFALSVRKAWKQARLARETPTPEAHHELRKRVKNLVLQLRQHRDENPGSDFRLARRLKKATDALGDSQDLDALIAHVARQPRRFPGEAPRTRLLTLAHDRARLLERKGRKLAAKHLKKLRRSTRSSQEKKEKDPAETN